jgi:sulfate-transporting ATPase
LTTAIQFAVFGLGIGAVFALLAQGLVVTYNGSGVLNFAHGAEAMIGAYVFWQLRHEEHWSFLTSFTVAVGGVTLIGLGIYQLIMRPLRTASSLARVVATLGVLVTAQGAAILIWGLNPKGLNSELTPRVFTIGGVIVPVDRLILVGIAAGLTAVLWATQRYTAVGLAVRAASENPRAGAAVGWSPDTLATVTWATGAALAATAGVLIAPLTGIDPEEMPLLVVPVMAAALVGGFTSLTLTFLGALAIGIAQSEIQQWVNLQGATWSIPFGLIVLLLVIRGKGVPVRGHVVERLPELGSGIVRWRYLVPAVVVFGYLLTVFPIRLVDALIISMAWATLMLSVVVLLGYTSQLSFEQMAMAGLATLIAARLVADLHWPFVAAFVVAVLAAVPIGILFAIPALRTRGVNLAVVTLGLGMVVTYMIFTNNTFTGGFEGISIGEQRLFGVSIDTVKYPERYALLVLAMFVACALAVANVRRGKSGSALVAVRTNERAASALGINVFSTKLFAFVVGSTVAAIGGLLYGFRSGYVQFDEFAPFQSVLVVSYAIIGGVALLLGPVVAAGFVAGGFGGWLFGQLIDTNNATDWLVLVGGVSLIVFVVLHPDGIASVQAHQFRWLEARVRRRLGRERAAAPEPLPDVPRERVGAAALHVESLSVRFGGVTAVDGVSLTVRSGEIVGLIGPNGAGKTTLIDAVTGFVRPAEGEVRLNDAGIGGWPAYRRARAGVSRSFQSLELFEDSSVRENLRVASDRRELRAYFADIVRPGHRPLSSAAVAAVHEFGLDAHLDHRVSDLPHGHRRLVAIARAIAVSPSILLLDEPASGLSAPEARELATVVRRLAAEWGLGILLIEHDMAFVMNACDRIHVLDFGRQIAAGAPAEIRTDPAVIGAYLGEPLEQPSVAVLAGDRQKEAP